MGKTKSIVILTIIAILIAVCGTATFASFSVPGTIYDYNSIFSTISKGIDLEGGYYAVLTPKVEEDELDKLDLDSVVNTLRQRLDDKGFTEATIAIQDTDSLRVEIPNVDSPDEVLEIIGSQGRLSFKDAAGVEYLSGDDIEDARAGYMNGEIVVVMDFTETGRVKFASATETLAAAEDNKLYIYLGDTLVSAPAVKDKIDSNSAQIEDIESYEEAESIAAVISSGALSIQFDIGEANQISSSLGDGVLKYAMISAGIGLLLIFAIMLLVYLGLGFSSVLALMIYIILYICILAIAPGVQLTLPGIAGIILSIGMAVDANVIIFDRIKEEYAKGKTFNSAVSIGFKRALVTVIDSNVTTIIASIILYLLGSGTIKGFAITFFFGILISMFTAVVVTRSILKLLIATSSNHEKFFGLKREDGINV